MDCVSHLSSLCRPGVGRQGRGEDGPSDAGRDQPGQLPARNHQGRFLHRRGQVSVGGLLLLRDDPLGLTLLTPFLLSPGRNIIHGSDSVESANKEIALWFKEDELVCYTSCAFTWLY